MATVLKPMEEASSRKDRWTEIQRESILQSCGYPSTTNWKYKARPTIWDIYKEEDCKPQDIIRVFQKAFEGY
jgi:hypothetical protein